MALKILQGNAKSDFLDIIADKILSLPAKEDTFLIVPNNLKFKTEINILNLLKQKTSDSQSSFFSLPNLKIYSFNRLVWYFLNDSSYFQLPELTTSMKDMILTSILLDHNDELKVYRNFTSDTGFIDLLREQIEIFEKEGISYKDLLELEGENLDLDKNSDLSLIYQNYEKAIDQPFRNEQCDFVYLSQYLATKDLSQTNFIFFNYLQFTKVETDLLMLLIEKAKNVYYVNYHDAVLKYDPTLENLNLLNIKSEQIDCSNNENNQLAAIFDSKLKVTEEQPKIKIYRCLDRYSEVKNLALKIVHLVRNESVRYNDILILGSQINNYEVIFKEIFSEYQIPYFGEFTNSMKNATITFILKKLLDLVNRRISIDDIFDLLKTQMFDVPTEVLIDAENFALKLGISGYDFLFLDLDNEKLKRSFPRDESKLEHFLLAKRLVCDLLVPLISSLKRSKSANEYANILYDFLSEEGIFDKFNQTKNDFYEAGQQLEGDQIEQEINTFTKLLDEITVIFGDREISLNDFSIVLLNGFKTKTYAMVPAVIDAVQISDINKVNLPDYKYVWIINSVDGNLPFVHDRNEYLLSSEEFEDIAKQTNNNFLLHYIVNFQNETERKMDYLSMSLPKTELYLSYASQDQEFPLLPSSYIRDIHEKFQIPIQDFDDRPENFDFNERLINPSTSLTDLVQIINQSLSDRNSIDANWTSLFMWFKQNQGEDFRKVLQALEISDNHIIEPTVIEKIFENSLLLSITNMETYFRNPYEFFVKYVLKIRERQISEVNPLVSGLVFHEVLDHFFKIIKKENKNLNELSDHDLENITNDVYKEVLNNQHLDFLLNDPINKFNIGILRQTVMSTLRSIKMQGLRSIPLFTEKSFGMSGDDIQPIYTLGQNQLLKINGKIDRLDLFEKNGEQFFNVIDYKSSNRKFDLNDFYSGLNLQLITYLQILKNYYFKEPFQKVGGSFFYQIQDPTIEHESIKTSFDQSWIKNYKYNGPFLNDENYLKIISDDLAANDLNWKDLFPTPKTKKNQNAYTEDEFNTIFDFNEKRFKTLGEMIYSGKFRQKILFKTFEDIQKYRSNAYQAILLFDPEINKDFRIWRSQSPDDLLRQMRGDAK